MAPRVLIIGESGTGKSASLRNLTPEQVLVINCAGKPLPFKNKFETVTPSFNRLTLDILNAMDSTSKKIIVIDDAQYIMSFQYMRRIHENGWDKWNDIQGDFFNIIQHCDALPDDTTVYFLSHLQRTEDGHEKVKTMGKMLDEKITIEGLFTIVLKTAVQDGQYLFVTQNSGMDTVKSPIGMFATYAIDNDLAYVDAKIRNYYEIGNYQPDMSMADAEVSKPDVEKPVAEGRKRRSRSTAQPLETPETPAVVPEAVPDEAPLETPEAPKTRRRKVRDNGQEKEEKPAEAPAEETKEETGRKRRRRKTEDWMNVDADGEIPFEM